MRWLQLCLLLVLLPLAACSLSGKTTTYSLEPRTVYTLGGGDTIRVKVEPGERAGMWIELDAVLMLSPVPERLRLSTMIDLDNGRATTAVEEA